MAEVEYSQQGEIPSQAEELDQKLDKMDISSSFSLWPPPQRTREAVINRLVKTLSTSSGLSKRYGSVTSEEASSIARSVEDQAFNAAGGASAGSVSIDDGIEILQLYSKEIGKLMLDTVKASNSDPNPDVSSVKSPDETHTDATAIVNSEEVSSVENESSN